MKGFLKTLLMIALSAITLISCIACQNGTDKNTDGEGILPSPTVLYRIEVDGGKREYEIGEEFDDENLVVTLIGETERVLTEDEYEIDFSSFKSNVSGEYVITVLYKNDKELKAEYTVRVKRDEENEHVWGKDMWL